MKTDIETGGPAFPVPFSTEDGNVVFADCYGNGGMTLRQYAAIKLRVPQSGDGWLDEMIREARRLDTAEKAMVAFMVASSDHSGTHPQCDERVAERAYEMANAMLETLEAK